MNAGNCIPVGTTITLTRQSDVDSFPINFPGCDIVDGDLIITGNDISNLIGLRALTNIYRLFIIGNPSLITLNGLNNITNIGYLQIKDNISLLILSGLNNLRKVGGASFENNSLIKNFIGLDNLVEISTDLNIENNNSLINFNGLNKLVILLYLEVSNNNSLVNLDGLQGLTYLDNFSISGNDSLKNLVGLNNITATNQHCRIQNNPLLISLNGLNNWKTMRSGLLTIFNNSSLVNLEGLNSLKSLGVGIEINANNSLMNLQGIDSLSILQWIIIENNPALTSLNGLNPFIKTDLFEVNLNPVLNCCYIAKLVLENNPTLTNIGISDNDIGCNSVPEVLALTPTSVCCIPTFKRDTIIICQGSAYQVGAHIYSISGIYRDTFKILAGCDSIIITNLIVHPKFYQIQNKNLCIGQSFTLSNGRVITTNGIYKDTIPNICDSIIEYHLNFLNNITVNQNASVCKGKTYVLPKGNVVSVSGIYRDTLRASFGCDSIVITNLTITNPTPFNNNVTICSGKTFIRPNGNIVSTTGTYYDTIKSPNTCDSIVITNLTVTPYLQSSQTVSVCLGKPYILPSGTKAYQNGIYKDTVRNDNGCDSIITTNLTITNPIPFTNTVSICDGQSYILPSGNKVSIPGTYTDTLRNANTCDSIVITNLSTFPNNFTVSLNATDTIESGNSLALNPIYTGGIATSWNWTPATNLSCTSCETPIASPVLTIQYIVDAKSQDGCEDTAQTKIVVRQTDVYVPTAFSPNGDGINDFAEVFANNPKSFIIKIYNRWGELVFESNDVNNKWNGTYKGQDCPVDSYSYILDVTLQNDKQCHKQSTILLLR